MFFHSGTVYQQVGIVAPRLSPLHTPFIEVKERTALSRESSIVEGLSSCGGGPVMCTTVATQVMKQKQSSPCSHGPPLRIVSLVAMWAPTWGSGPAPAVAKHLLKYFGCPKHSLTTPPPKKNTYFEEAWAQLPRKRTHLDVFSHWGFSLDSWSKSWDTIKKLAFEIKIFDLINQLNAMIHVIFMIKGHSGLLCASFNSFVK